LRALWCLVLLTVLSRMVRVQREGHWRWTLLDRN